MAVWLVRAGAHGEREDLALEQGLAVIGWMELADLSDIHAREDLEALCYKTYPDRKHNTVVNWVGQLWAFLGRIQIGDLVVLPLKKRSIVAIGRFKGPYQYRPDLPADCRHTRPVDWVRPDVPRVEFDQDLLASMRSLMTVCQIQRRDAEERIRAMMEGRPAQKPPIPGGSDGESLGEAPLDLEEYADDQIRTHIAQKLKGHGLAQLVTALLAAQGYQTHMSPAGADGGVDVIAGRGPLGFDPPRLVVQVKSSDQPMDVKVLRELQGVMKDFGAEQGLLISWGGFKQSVLNEARRHYFEIRLWDAGDLVRVLEENYERLPEDLQAELPLKRIWTLVLEE